MIWLIIVGVIALTIGIKNNFRWPWKYIDWFDLTVGGLILPLLITFLVAGGIMGGLNLFTNYSQTSSTTYQLVNIQQGTSTQGSFFLGSGYVDSQPSFSYYIKDGNTYELESAAAAGSQIIYTKDTPHVVYDTYGSSHYWLLSPYLSFNGEYSATFYIPPNSIEQNFSLGDK